MDGRIQDRRGRYTFPMRGDRLYRYILGRDSLGRFYRVSWEEIHSRIRFQSFVHVNNLKLLHEKIEYRPLKIYQEDLIGW